LLLHGFPELAYSWRKVMLPLAEAGFHVVVLDQRGYGRTIGWDSDYDGDLGSFRFLNLVRDALGLVSALGYCSVAAVIGHDFGSPVAAWCALLRPDVFRSVVLMSAPFPGPPAVPFDTAATSHAGTRKSARTIHDELRHSTARANLPLVLLDTAPDANGVTAAGHPRSCAPLPIGADWKANKPRKLVAGGSASPVADSFYHGGTRARRRYGAAFLRCPPACQLTREARLRPEFARTGFQGGLNWYRCRTVGWFDAELEIFSGRTIDVPSCFISGKSDWGVYQAPGTLEKMQTSACTRMLGCHLVEGAGHWVQQEQGRGGAAAHRVSRPTAN
jgi:pimeloyl-ACP methyl ester carboxylesterase